MFDSTNDSYFLESFKFVRVELFKSIVIKFGVNRGLSSLSKKAAAKSLKVCIPKGQSVPVLINREKNVNHGYWDHDVSEIDASCELDFVDLFDWDSCGVLDMSIVMAKVVGCEASPRIVNHFLLIDIKYVEILVSIIEDE